MDIYKCCKAYREQFNQMCGLLEPGPGDCLGVKNPETGKNYISSCSETEETFMDRLERSKIAGRNLFYEEWEEFVYNPNYIY